ncbi:MAG: hypothetical protein C5B58_09175 [Acidobacteria bacterium]|nr:MAG: hypothetical protein C5B58_09175 [Acidobacteriota bacterium]
MAAPAETPSSVRFAEFVLDLRTRELSNRIRKVSLQEQPFQILSALLERPGELVTRDELRNRLWPSDVFVDFEHSLNKAVNRLREVLEDSAEHPRFIETLPRRGYRWIAPILLPTDSGTTSATDTAVAGAFTKSAKPMRWSSVPALWTVAALAIVLIAMLAWRFTRQQAPTDASWIHSLAVLPLESLSGDSTQAYFTDGMTDQLITDLGQISELRVISRTSMMKYKGTRKPLQQIARELSVDAIVEGTVLRSGNQVRITAQLVKPDTDRHLWAQSYDGDMRDILGLQNQVAAAIASQVKKKLIRDERAAATPSRSVSMAAYEAFLHGASLPLTTDGARTRIRYFEEAVRLQPDYAEAYAEIGYSYNRLGHMLAIPPQEAFPKAQAAASKLLEIDPLLHHGHIIAGNVKFLYEWDFAGAAEEMQRALKLNPNSSYAHRCYADFLNAMGRPDEAVAEMEKLGAIDPLDLDVPSQMAGELYFARRYDEAIAQARKVLVQNPNNDGAHLWLGLALEQKGDFPNAVAELKKAAELSNNKMWIGFVARTQALAGDRAGAQRILQDFQRLSRRSYVSPWWFSVIYSGLGDKEQVFVWLEKAYQGREHDLAFANAWPVFDRLHSDPRYQDLIRRVGLSTTRTDALGIPGS